LWRFERLLTSLQDGHDPPEEEAETIGLRRIIILARLVGQNRSPEMGGETIAPKELLIGSALSLGLGKGRDTLSKKSPG
jgi:hypothetical protein